MKWAKEGLIYEPDGELWWAHQYAIPPTPHVLDERVLRLYIGSCDEHTVGRVGYVDVLRSDPSQIVAISAEPVLDIGEPGSFDDNGVVPTRVLDVGGRLYMYYVGYQLGTKVRYFQFEGLAVSDDGGQSFTRVSRVPVTDRSDAEGLNRTSAFVDVENGVFRMWYTAGGEWIEVDGKPLPRYNLRYLESKDGITWGPDGRVCVDFASDDEHALGRPWVFGHDGRYKMLYSSRTRSKGYRLGYAESHDGIEWTRRDDEVGIGVSSSGWDSEEISYSSVVFEGDAVYLFYNGNDRGKAGFGYAELEHW